MSVTLLCLKEINLLTFCSAFSCLFVVVSQGYYALTISALCKCLRILLLCHTFVGLEGPAQVAVRCVQVILEIRLEEWWGNDAVKCLNCEGGN